MGGPHRIFHSSTDSDLATGNSASVNVSVQVSVLGPAFDPLGCVLVSALPTHVYAHLPGLETAALFV